MKDYYIGGGHGTTPCANHQQRKYGMKCTAQKDAMTLNEAKAELEKFVKLKTTMRPTFVDVLLNAEKWIPVTERLPNDFEEVIITWVNRDPEYYYADIKDKPFTGVAVYFSGKWFWYSAVCQDYLKEYGSCYENEMGMGIDVIAWMPLPEPYKDKE